MLQLDTEHLTSCPSSNPIITAYKKGFQACWKLFLFVLNPWVHLGTASSVSRCPSG